MSTRGADRGGSGGGRQSDGHRWGSPRRAMAGDRHRPPPGPTPALPGGAVGQPPRRREREREAEGERGREGRGRRGGGGVSREEKRRARKGGRVRERRSLGKEKQKLCIYLTCADFEEEPL